MPYAIALPKFAASDSLRLVEAWQRWRGDRLLPDRSDLDLVDIKLLLPRICLVEVRSATEAVFRLAGSQIREELGFELTGQNYVELSEPESRVERGRLLWAEVRQPCGAVMLYRHYYASGFELPAEIVSLPLNPDKAGSPMLVVALVTVLQRPPMPGDAPGVRVLSPGRELRFFDIGAGVPD